MGLTTGFFTMPSMICIRDITLHKREALQAFCETQGIVFTEEPDITGPIRVCSEVNMTPNKALANFLGPQYLNRYGKTQPKLAFDCIVNHAKRKGIYNAYEKSGGILLDDILQSVFATEEKVIDLRQLPDAVEALFQP